MRRRQVDAVKGLARGRVQRVGYRRYLLDIAQKLGVKGYVRNLPDGSVEFLAQAEPRTLKQFLEKAENPPSPILVEKLEKKPVKPNPRLRYFQIRFGKLAEELQEGFGAMEKEFRDYRQEFRDFREEFRDFRGEFRDFRNEFNDYRQEFRDFRSEFREFAKRTDENFKLILEKYGEISDKLTEILETLIRESRETREQLNRSMQMLSEAITLLRDRLEK